MPTVETISQTIQLHGMVCLDLNKDLTCDPDAAGVINVIIRSSDGSIAASDKTGDFSLPVVSGTQITLVAPGGYIFPNGSYQAMQVITSTQTKFAVWEEPTPQPIPTVHLVASQGPYPCCVDDFGAPIFGLVLTGIWLVAVITLTLAVIRILWRRRKA